MINWELPPDAVPCPHCGATETQITLQLLGLIRYGCNSCRKSFAVKSNGKVTPTVPPAATSPS
jgi:transposase-like protein